jgi:hypothetical protein
MSDRKEIDWSKAIAEMRDPLPMEAEIWAAAIAAIIAKAGEQK